MKNIAIFTHQPLCSKESARGIKKSLNKYNFINFGAKKLKNDFFDNIDMVVFPGGIGDATKFYEVMEENGEKVVDFVKNGGKYLGICMGAYWAGKDYFNIAPKVKIQQYITRPNSQTHRPHPKSMPITWGGVEDEMFFYDGPTMVGGNQEVIATYPNKDPMATIVNKNVGLIGCHPESEKVWFEYYSWLNGKYHQGRHHKILESFVDTLIQ